MEGRPSTSSRTSPSSRSVMAVTLPRRRLSAMARELDELEGDAEHALQVGDCDALVGRVHLQHSVGEVDAAQAARVEDVCVRAAAGVDRARRQTRVLDRLPREPEGGFVGAEAVAWIGLADRRLDLALGHARGEGEALDHLLDEVGELALVSRARFGGELAAIRNHVARRAAADTADVGGRLVVDPAEAKVGNRAGGSDDGRAALLGRQAGMSGPPLEHHVDRPSPRRRAHDVPDRPRRVVDESALGLEPRVVERERAQEADLLANREQELEARMRAMLREHDPRGHLPLVARRAGNRGQLEKKRQDVRGPGRFHGRDSIFGRNLRLRRDFGRPRDRGYVNAAPATRSRASARSRAAPTKSRKSGPGRVGRDLNSGWNWLATNQGWSASSMISTRRPSWNVPETTSPASTSWGRKWL